MVGYIVLANSLKIKLFTKLNQYDSTGPRNYIVLLVLKVLFLSFTGRFSVFIYVGYAIQELTDQNHVTYSIKW